MLKKTAEVKIIDWQGKRQFCESGIAPFGYRSFQKPCHFFITAGGHMENKELAIANFVILREKREYRKYQHQMELEEMDNESENVIRREYENCKR